MRRGLLRSPTVRIISFILLFLIALLHLAFAVHEQMVFTGRIGGLRPEQIRSSRLLTNDAQTKHLFEADFAAAESMLQRALALNPFYVPAWLSLVTLYNDQGERQQAEAVFEYVSSLIENINRWRWDSALVAYQIGKTEVLPEELNYIIGHIPGKQRRDALQLAFTLWEDGKELLANIGPDNVSHLFNYAVRTRHPDHALYFYKVMEQKHIPWQEKELLACIDMLLGVGQVAGAAKIWRHHFNADAMIYNGDFKKPFLQRAFGWRKGKGKGFAIRIDPAGDDAPSNGVQIRFKGWYNLIFRHFYQFFPVQPEEHYALTAEMKTKQMTTDQRPFLEVFGYKCEVQHQVSDMVESEQDWRHHSIYFSVPEECSAMVVRLRRKESRQLDNKISGQLWIRNVAIRQIDAEQSSMDY